MDKFEAKISLEPETKFSMSVATVPMTPYQVEGSDKKAALNFLSVLIHTWWTDMAKTK